MPTDDFGDTYRFLEMTILRYPDPCNPSWRSPVAEAALRQDFEALVKCLPTSRLGHYAAHDRPLDNLIKFFSDCYPCKEGNEWLMERSLLREQLIPKEAARILINAGSWGKFVELKGLLETGKVDDINADTTMLGGNNQLPSPRRTYTAFDRAMVSGSIERCEVLLKHGFKVSPELHAKIKANTKRDWEYVTQARRILQLVDDCARETKDSSGGST